jgi:hypothetical protein
MASGRRFPGSSFRTTRAAGPGGRRRTEPWRAPRYGARGGTTGGAAVGRRAVGALVADGRSESNTGRRDIRTGESEAAAALEAGYTMVIVSV